MEVCVKYGWCLKPSDHDALLAVDARDSDVITDEIIRAEMGAVRRRSSDAGMVEGARGRLAL